MSSVIRFADRMDAAAFAEIYRPAVLERPTSFETEAPSCEEMAARIQEIAKMFPWLSCEWNGHVAGYAYASLHRARPAYQWSVDVSVYVGDAYHRLGIGKRLYLCLLDIVRRQGFVNAFAGITIPNDGSVRLHESLGFRQLVTYRHVGYKFGAWHDVGWWSLDLNEPQPNPAPPTPLPELIGAGGFRPDEFERYN